MRARAVTTLYALVTVGCGRDVPPSAPHASLGQPVSVALPTDRGELGALPKPGATVTVADFFSPACQPCREKVPALWARKAEIESMGGALVLVSVLGDGESTTDARKALAGWGVPNAPFLVDSGDASRREVGVRALPTTIVLDGRGIVRWVAPADASTAQTVAAARAAAH